MLQVFPEHRHGEVAELYGDVSRTRRHDRPWIVMSMISSADGAMSIEGVSGGLGGSTDRAVLRHLRSMASGVLVGAQTVRSEAYSPLPPHQTLAVVSRSADLGARADELRSAGNTIVVSGDARTICSSLDGDIWVLEGGPSLNAQMLAVDCVDEICLTISPKFVAGEIGRIVTGQGGSNGRWNLSFIAHDDGYVFLRYMRS